MKSAGAACGAIHEKKRTDTGHLVTTALQELAAHPITVRLVTPAEEPRWNKWGRKHP